ncbi:MAG TPA: hypothetical protein VK466_10200 [Terriglobales bacterium]|nr:hypothetical protein [Terriglobales bacterium]
MQLDEAHPVEQAGREKGPKCLFVLRAERPADTQERFPLRLQVGRHTFHRQRKLRLAQWHAILRNLFLNG